MPLNPTFDIGITYDLSVAIPRFVFKDSNDYVGNGDSLVGGKLTVISPSGQVVYQTPSGSYTITPSQLSFDGVSIPVNLQGHIIKGKYSFTYTVITTNEPKGYSKEKHFEYDFCTPKIEIVTEIDCFIARLSSRDVTGYDFKGITPQLVRVHEVHFPSLFNLNHLSSNHELHYVNHPHLYEGTYTSKITSELSYAFKENVTIKTRSKAEKDTIVRCDINLCKIYCKVKSLKNRADQLLCENRNSYLKAQKTLLEVTALMVLFEHAMRCGESDVAGRYLEQIKSKTGDCKAGCNCSDKEKPRQIQPFLQAVTSNTTNKWLGGSGVPSTLLGNNDDYYINHSSGDVYEKINGTWTLQLNINGQGIPGQNGAGWHSGSGIPATSLGSDNDHFFSITTSDVYKKTSGNWGSPIANLKGDQGIQGVGIQGPPGPPGNDGTTIFSGFIAMYSGSMSQFSNTGLGMNDLAGWALCNGNNGTPNLKGRFIVGYDESSKDYNTIGKVGGTSAVTLTKSQSGMPAHSHGHNISASSETAGDHAHVGYEWPNNANLGSGGSSASSNKQRRSYTTSTAGLHSHQINIHGEVSRNEGMNAAQAHENRPPYYTLAFIMKI